MNPTQRYDRAVDELFARASRIRFNEVVINNWFRCDVVQGIYRLYDVHDKLKTRSGSESDLKKALISEYHDASRTTGPIEYFRFVVREDLVHCLPADLAHLA